MFTKVSLKSFVYDLTKTFFFSNKKAKEIYNKYMIERISPYSILTDTKSVYVLFIFICKQEICTLDSQMFCLNLLLTTIFYTDFIPHTTFEKNIQSEINP